MCRTWSGTSCGRFGRPVTTTRPSPPWAKYPSRHSARPPSVSGLFMRCMPRHEPCGGGGGGWLAGSWLERRCGPMPSSSDEIAHDAMNALASLQGRLQLLRRRTKAGSNDRDRALLDLDLALESLVRLPPLIDAL